MGYRLRGCNFITTFSTFFLNNAAYMAGQWRDSTPKICNQHNRLIWEEEEIFSWDFHCSVPTHEWTLEVSPLFFVLSWIFFVHPHTHTLKTRGFLHSDVKYPSIEEEKRKWILLSKGFFTYQWVLHDHLSLILSRDYFKWRQSLDLHKDGKEIEWELFQTLFHNV